MMGVMKMFTVRHQINLKFSDLFFRTKDGAAVPLRKILVADELISGAGKPVDGLCKIKYVSHNLTFDNVGKLPLGMSVSVPYVGGSAAEFSSYLRKLPAQTEKCAFLEGSELTANQLNHKLKEFNGVFDEKHLISGIRLAEFEAVDRFARLPGPEEEDDCEIVINLTLNYRRIGVFNEIKAVKCYISTERPWESDFVDEPRRAPTIIQFPDDGYPYVGLYFDKQTQLMSLYWANQTGLISPVRIRSLEDPNIRLVVPALTVTNDNLDTSGRAWVARVRATQFGFDETNAVWCVYRHSAPYVFNGNPQYYNDCLPKEVDSTTPVLMYYRVRPSVLKHELPEFPMEQLPALKGEEEFTFGAE